VALHVLVVDDSAIMRAIMIKTLHLCGIPIEGVRQAGNGLEGLQQLQAPWADLVLVDINMPVMSGTEMIARLRAEPATAALPVIVVSTDGSLSRSEMARAQGAGFVRKPFTPEDLRDAIAGVMGVSHEQLAGGPALPSDGPDF
jgi:two-component system, chemotaxis family, chemotaxis protein CheY